MNMFFEKITEEYTLIGFPGLINCGFPPTAAGSHKIIESFAKKAINSNNKKGFEYDAFAAYTFGDTKWANPIVDECAKTKGLDLLLVQPLKKIS